ncbi:LexA family transcriptional regulator [Dyadobacter sp. CY312]|uniref:LexA family protein n=1 Tax=Dyadobacter sp. CY312 TaxID=2907303 RepID=UPI001F1C8EF4|nr:translesion error-prone DNA polymerase V autoproteolytic subunit [Dyadobacter sp. CY312]MCE7039202.1 translesion error-prone DNA polymerase V autoproteolytic subunit [Dyadobacter sp. CY312]
MGAIPLYTSVHLDIYPVGDQEARILPFIPGISAGFPSPAADFIDLNIDLTKELIQNPSSTFFGRVKGDSMKGAGIDDGDLMIIDKSLKAKQGSIVVCFIDGDFTVKRITFDKKTCWLIAENDKYPPIQVTEDNDMIIWGVVINAIKYL